MNEHLPPRVLRQPSIGSVEDVLVYKLARMVAINERNGHRWSRQRFDLSVNEMFVLGLVQAHGTLRAGDLSELLVMDKSQLSRLIKALTTRKLLRNRPDRKDARAIALSLTAKGEKLFGEVLREIARRNENVLAPLTPEEVATFDGMLDRLIAHNLMLWQANPHNAGR